jgi:hypothetical protein
MHINWLAVIAAAVINMIIGGIWYSPAMFGASWMALIGKRREEIRGGAGRAYILAFIVALVFAYVLARFVRYAGAHSLGRGALIGFLAWIGFVATSGAGDVIFAGRPVKLYAITNGYQLVTFIINGALLAAWS